MRASLPSSVGWESCRRPCPRHWYLRREAVVEVDVDPDAEVVEALLRRPLQPLLPLPLPPLPSLGLELRRQAWRPLSVLCLGRFPRRRLALCPSLGPCQAGRHQLPVAHLWAAQEVLRSAHRA